MSELYLYSRWVRIWHWLNALLFLVLILSGASMHFSDAGWLLGFAAARLIHNVAGIALTIGWIVFVIGNLATDNGHHYRLQWRGGVQRLFIQARYYAYGIFRNEPPPFHPSVNMKFNFIQQLTYLGVMYLLIPLLIFSGWGFLFSIYLPEMLLGLGSIWMVAMTHLSVAYLLVLFLLLHLYLVTTGETLMEKLRAMLSGWHQTSPE